MRRVGGSRRRPRALIGVLLGALVCAPVPAPVAATAATPAARWTFDAGSGNTVADSVGTATGTRAGGASWITSNAAVGTGAMHFDGVDGHVDIANQAALEPTGFTLTMWVRSPANDRPVYPQIIAQKGAFDCDGPSWKVGLLDNGFLLKYRGNQGQQVFGFIGDETLRTNVWDGTWHFLAFSVGGTGGFISMAVDGSPKLLMNWLNGPIQYTGATDGTLRVGGPLDTACGDDYFKGDIDDLRLYADPNFDDSTLLTPIPTTTTIDPISSPQSIGKTMPFHVEVSPAPKWGKTILQYINTTTDTVVSQGEINLGADGTLTTDAYVEPPAGDYELRVAYQGQGPWQPSEDSVTYTATRVPTSTVVTVSPASPVPLSQTVITATITGDWELYQQRPEGSVDFYDSTSGTPVLLGSVATEYVGYYIYGQSQAKLTLPSGLDVGDRKLSAVYTTSNGMYASSTSPTNTVTVPKAESAPYVYSDYQVEANHAIQLHGSVWPAGAWSASGATMSFYREGVATPICSLAVAVDAETLCQAPALPLGTYRFYVTYSGNARTEPGTSDSFEMTVVSDVLHASGVRVSAASIYPYKDGYKDTLKITGVREEPITVTIKIYKPSGGLLRTVTLAKGSGSYSWTWNGKTSSGSILPEGKYRITQTLKDAGTGVASFTSYVTLSKKRLVTLTKTITKLGSSFTATGTAGTGSVKVSSAGSVRLSTGGAGWAGVGWQFSLPSATLYKSMKFKVYAKGSFSVPPTEIAMQNFVTCPYVSNTNWDTGCFNRWTSIGSGTTTAKWYSMNGSVTSNRSGTKVRGLISDGYGTWYVYKAEIVVTYGVLKY